MTPRPIERPANLTDLGPDLPNWQTSLERNGKAIVVIFLSS
jgi:hypothetical protein